MTRLITAAALVLTAGCASSATCDSPASAPGAKRLPNAGNTGKLASRTHRAKVTTPRPSPSAASRDLRRPALGNRHRVWARLAACESAGRWHLDGAFDGGLQFTEGTWLAYGGGSYAAHAYDATVAEQITVARRVLAAQGWAAWPVCSVRIGVTS